MIYLKKDIDIYIENTQKYNTFYLCLCIHQNLDKSTAVQNRLLPLVLSAACEKYTDIASLNIALANTGGAELAFQTVKKGGRAILQFLISAPKGNEEAVFELLSELVCRPLLKNGKFAVSRKDMLRSIIENKKADKKAYALDRCIEIMFDGKGFGTDGDGSLEELDKPFDLYAHYKKVLASSKKEVFVIGDISQQNASELTEKYFGGLKSTDMTFIAQKPAPPGFTTEKADIAQAKLCVGLTAGKGDRFVKSVYSEILGGSGTSRLFNTVREKDNLCYYINSIYYSLADAFFIQAGIKAENLEQTLAAIKEAISSKPSYDETQNAVKTMISRLKSIEDHPLALIDFYMTQGIFGDDMTPQKAIQCISGIEQTDVVPKINTVYILGGENNDISDLAVGCKVFCRTEKRLC